MAPSWRRSARGTRDPSIARIANKKSSSSQRRQTVTMVACRRCLGPDTPHMVRVIEKAEDAGELACIEFRVYLKPTDDTVVFGEMTFAESAGSKAPITITTSNLGVPVEAAFVGTLEYANRRNIPFVWVNDPRGLFPPSKRPAT
jgi:hypothetical protein